MPHDSVVSTEKKRVPEVEELQPNVSEHKVPEDAFLRPDDDEVAEVIALPPGDVSNPEVRMARIRELEALIERLDTENRFLCQ